MPSSIKGGFASTIFSSVCSQLLEGTEFMFKGVFQGSSSPTLGSESREPLVYHMIYY